MYFDEIINKSQFTQPLLPKNGKLKSPNHKISTFVFKISTKLAKNWTWSSWHVSGRIYRYKRYIKNYLLNWTFSSRRLTLTSVGVGSAWIFFLLLTGHHHPLFIPCSYLFDVQYSDYQLVQHLLDFLLTMFQLITW